MKRAYSIGLLLALTLVLCGACDDDDGGMTGTRTVRGNGVIVSEDRMVGGFTAVTHASEGALQVVVGAQDGLRIEADENLLQHITTQIQGGVLEIRTESGIDIVPTQTIRFFLTVVDLESVLLSGVGDVELPDLTANTLALTVSGVGSIDGSTLTVDQLSLTLSGVGDIDCSDADATSIVALLSGVGSIRCAGVADTQTVTASGVGSYDAPNLLSQEATLTVGDLSSATVNVSVSLAATVTGNGSVRYVDSSGGGLIVQCTPSGACNPL